LALATLLGVLGIWALAGAGVAAVPKCPSFGSQAEAQDYFFEMGGSPTRKVGGLDGDRDGVACEELAGPYKGYATVAYSSNKNFFYGTASMPPIPAGGFACLEGNRRFDDGPRVLHLYLVKPGPDRPLLDIYGAGTEARPASGRLFWKVNKPLVTGSYYVVFEERVPLSPYGRNECPGFESHPTALPKPR